jgi:hypothetical protein
MEVVVLKIFQETDDGEVVDIAVSANDELFDQVKCGWKFLGSAGRPQLDDMANECRHEREILRLWLIPVVLPVFGPQMGFLK